MVFQYFAAAVLLGGIAVTGFAAQAVHNPAQEPPKGTTFVNAVSISSVPVLRVDELRKELAAPNPPLLIDVREPEERVAGKLDNDINIPLPQLEKRFMEIPKDRPVVIYCRSGNRSGQAARFLMEKGYTNVRNLTGGMIAWSKRCDSTTKAC